MAAPRAGVSAPPAPDGALIQPGEHFVGGALCFGQVGVRGAGHLAGPQRPIGSDQSRDAIAAELTLRIAAELTR